MMWLKIYPVFLSLQMSIAKSRIKLPQITLDRLNITQQ